MSAVRCEQPVYKVFEPGYHTHRPIIVDEAIESPETVTLRYEEEAARANGGDLRGDSSPPGLLPMSAYKPQPPQLHGTPGPAWTPDLVDNEALPLLTPSPSVSGFTESPYSQFSAQSFSNQQAENAASQMNQMAFAADNAATAYLTTGSGPGASASLLQFLYLSPTAGVSGTRVTVKLSSSYDLHAMTASEPFAWLVFGAHRCPGQLLKEVESGSYTYVVSAEAPQFVATHCTSPHNVPISLLIESTGGEELARVDNAGVFVYQSAQGDGGSGDAGPPDALGTRRNSQSPGHQTSPPQSSHGVAVRTDTTSPTADGDKVLQADSSTTNSYDYPPGAAAAVAAQAQAQAQVQSNFVAAAAYNQGTADAMLGAYRSTSFVDHYSRAPSSLRSTHGAWTYGAHIGSARSPLTSIAHHAHTTITRPSLSHLSHPNGAPQLVRTSTLQQGTGNAAVSNPYNPYALYPTKAQLKINGDLDVMANDWTEEEWENRRRIVLFKKSQHGSQLTASFRPVSVNERPPNSICISCIWWAEKNECFVTSVDTISLLEQLVAAPARFTVEEKNRIRRNLEGFHPLTVSKAKSESEEFFKVIMSFGNPKPRNIEKDVKVFPWKILSQALKKIISKYSASPSSTVPPSTPTHLPTPVSLSGAYPVLPPTPGAAVGGTGSPRAISAAAVSSAWPATYAPTAAAPPSRTLSPAGPKPNSPQSGGGGLRISTLQSTYDTRTSTQSVVSPTSLTPSTHYSPHHSSHAVPGYTTSTPVSQAHSTRTWEAYSVPDSYATGQSHTHTHTHAAHTHGHSGAYGSTATYGDGAQRA